MTINSLAWSGPSPLDRLKYGDCRSERGVTPRALRAWARSPTLTERLAT